MKKKILLISLFFSLTSLSSAVFSTPSPPGAAVYIISPAHGEIVSNPVTVKFGLSGMGVAPAGVNKINTGHHHLLIDLENLPTSKRAIPKNANHRHFGGGQTEITFDLAPGIHTLQLLLGDMAHIPHQPAIVSEKITITVK